MRTCLLPIDASWAGDRAQANTVPEHEPLRTITVTSGSTRQCASDVAEDDDVDVNVDEEVEVAVRDDVAVAVEVREDEPVAVPVCVLLAVDDPEPVPLPVLDVVAVAVPEEVALPVAEPVVVAVPDAVCDDDTVEVAELEEDAVAELDRVAVAELLKEDDAVDVADSVLVADAVLVAEAVAEDEGDADAVNEPDVESEDRDAPQSAGQAGTVPPQGQTRFPLKYVPAQTPLVEMYMPPLTSTGSLERRGEGGCFEVPCNTSVDPCPHALILIAHARQRVVVVEALVVAARWEADKRRREVSGGRLHVPALADCGGEGALDAADAVGGACSRACLADDDAQPVLEGRH